MVIRMLTSMAGIDFSLSPGEEYECSAKEAERLVASGAAELIREVKMEKAVTRAKKTASKLFSRK